MKNTKNTLVLFDVGAVLLELKYSGFYEEAAKIKGCAPEEFKELYARSQIELKALQGKLNPKESTKQLLDLLGNPNLSELERLDSWGGPINSVIDLKQKLYFDSGVSVGIFSNIDQKGVERIERTWPAMLRTFDPEAPFICSYLSGDVKPNTPMYQDVQKFNFKEVIFIDDKESYLKIGVEQFGWKGILFTPYKDSAEAIKSFAGHEGGELSGENYRTANSVGKLEQSLRDFGIKI